MREWEILTKYVQGLKCNVDWPHKTHSCMRPKAGRSWGWENWWGWVSKCSPFRVILPGPRLHGSQNSRCRGTFLQLKHAWDTKRMVHRLIGKSLEKAPHLLVLGFSPPASFLTISPLGESAPSTSCFEQFAICPEDEGEGGWGEPMRDKP